MAYILPEWANNVGLDKVFIYTLSHNNEIRYVGKTNSVKTFIGRHNGHVCMSSQKNSYKRNWVESVGGDIEMEIIDVCDKDEWEFFEKYWISQLKTWGFSLTNLAEGGVCGGMHKLSSAENLQKRIEKQRTEEMRELSRKKMAGKTKTTYEERKNIEILAKTNMYSLSELGDMVGLTYSAIYNMLKKRGVSIKRTTLSSKEKRRKEVVSQKLTGRKQDRSVVEKRTQSIIKKWALKDEVEDEILQLYKTDGYSALFISKKFNISRKRVAKILNKNNIDTNYYKNKKEMELLNLNLRP